MTRVLLSAGIASLVSALLTHGCKDLARRLDMVAAPKQDRWHRQPVPLLGGVGIVATILLVAPFASGQLGRSEMAFLAGGIAMFVVGLVDDRRTLAPQSKLVAQISIASLVAGAGLRLGLTPYPAVDVLVTIVWIVAITNAFNLLDNMDGLAAGVAFVAVAFRLGFLIRDGNIEAAITAAVFMGAVLGFLFHNFPPASIFMGDAGSLFVGYSLAGLSLIGGYPYSRSVVSIVVFPLLILLVPIFDTTLVTITRALAGRRISAGGRDHASHRLVAIGLSERTAVLSLQSIAVVSGLVALCTYSFGLSYGLVFVVFLALGLVLFGLYLGQITVYTESPPARQRQLMRLVATFPYAREVASVVADFVLAATAYYVAYMLRFDGSVAGREQHIIGSLPLVIGSQMLAFGLFRVHNVVWRYTGIRDLVRVVAAASVGTLAGSVGVLIGYGFEEHTGAVFLLDWILLVVFVTASRVSFRILREMLGRGATGPARRVLVYGADDSGQLVFREIQNDPAFGRQVVGFIDDGRGASGALINGVPVLGGADQLEDILGALRVAEVIVASSAIPTERLTQVSRTCQMWGVTIKRASLQFDSDIFAGSQRPRETV